MRIVSLVKVEPHNQAGRSAGWLHDCSGFGRAGWPAFFLSPMKALRVKDSSQVESSHTPGPWEIVDSYCDPNTSWTLRQFNGGKLGLYIGSVDKSIPSSSANARLIAAAPELLEALEAMLDIAVPDRANIRPHEDCGCYSCRAYNVIEQARAAIARAKGGAQCET